MRKFYQVCHENCENEEKVTCGSDTHILLIVFLIFSEAVYPFRLTESRGHMVTNSDFAILGNPPTLNQLKHY